MQFSERLRDVREKSNLNQTEVGERIGASTSTISMYERGERIPDYKVLLSLANVFGVSTDYLTGKSDDPIVSNNKFQKERLIELRGSRTIEEYAELTGVSSYLLDRYENGIEEPVLSILMYIADFEGIDVRYFYDQSVNIVRLNRNKAFDEYEKELREWLNSSESKEYIEFAYNKVYKKGITKEQLKNGRISITLD